jgi:hypothetical protein
MPAPALLSDPAMVRATGMFDGRWLIVGGTLARDLRRFNVSTFQRFNDSTIQRPLLRSVISDGFDWTSFHRFLAQRLFIRTFRLFINVGVAAVVVAFEIGRRGFAAQIAVDALIVDVKFSCYVLGVFVRSVGHGFSR